jgi:hypothetical protein
MRHRRFKTRTKPEALTIADLVEGMERFGASFYFSGNGSLMVRNLAKLPAALVDQFLNCDGRALTALIRSREGNGKATKAMDQAAYMPR